MSVINQFTVEADGRGRILGYLPEGSEQLVTPTQMGEFAGKRIAHKDVEYDLDVQGNLIHPDVELPQDIILGHGVLLGAGVKFPDVSEAEVEEKGPEDVVMIDDHALIPENTFLFPGVYIGDHAIIRAVSVGRRTMIGSHARIRENSTVGSNANIGVSVKIGQHVYVGDGTSVGDNVKIPDYGYIGSRVEIGKDCQFEVDGEAIINFRGRSVTVQDGVVVPPKNRIVRPILSAE